MRDREFLTGRKYQAQHKRAVRDGAHPDIIGGIKPGKTPGVYVECRGFEPVFRRRMEALGVPMFAHCVVRTAELQNELHAKGNSKARAGDSPHNFGMAVDIVHGTRAWDLNAQQWALVGHVGKEVALALGIKVEWGGDWKFYDPAHWELVDWRSHKEEYPWLKVK